jgi:hypothetical protein
MPYQANKLVSSQQDTVKIYLNSILAWNAATGRNGVAVSFESLSLSDDAERVRDEEVKAVPGSETIGEGRDDVAIRFRRGGLYMREDTRVQ